MVTTICELLKFNPQNSPAMQENQPNTSSDVKTAAVKPDQSGRLLIIKHNMRLTKS
jgi:hypothetical protein